MVQSSDFDVEVEKKRETKRGTKMMEMSRVGIEIGKLPLKKKMKKNVEVGEQLFMAIVIDGSQKARKVSHQPRAENQSSQFEVFELSNQFLKHFRIIGSLLWLSESMRHQTQRTKKSGAKKKPKTKFEPRT